MDGCIRDPITSGTARLFHAVPPGNRARETTFSDAFSRSVNSRKAGRPAVRVVNNSVLSDEEIVADFAPTSPIGPASRPAMDMEFTATLWEWRGPAPFSWLSLPEDACDAVRFESAQASYGWGAVPVRIRIGATDRETSLLAEDGGTCCRSRVRSGRRNTSRSVTRSRWSSASLRAAAVRPTAVARHVDRRRHRGPS